MWNTTITRGQTRIGMVFEKCPITGQLICTDPGREMDCRDTRIAKLEAENARFRDILVRTRAVLKTALGDEPGDLDKPERANVLRRRIAEISGAIGVPSPHWPAAESQHPDEG